MLHIFSPPSGLFMCRARLISLFLFLKIQASQIIRKKKSPRFFGRSSLRRNNLLLLQMKHLLFLFVPLPQRSHIPSLYELSSILGAGMLVISDIVIIIAIMIPNKSFCWADAWQKDNGKHLCMKLYTNTEMKKAAKISKGDGLHGTNPAYRKIPFTACELEANCIFFLCPVI